MATSAPSRASGPRDTDPGAPYDEPTTVRRRWTTTLAVSAAAASSGPAVITGSIWMVAVIAATILITVTCATLLI
ncbi:MAG: hypothetical protein GXY65_10515 [Rhodococcus sp.]|uniref:hypothetical protein n=1 Tax=Rhodococcus TaxID=1827 RepID=UPI0016BB0A9A|nr:MULTISPECIES: hypothetical protein [Rhodococcus]NLV79751.1 hypothetical protein [Rhodococcus sp. (in: high G+C Gram-positive bacteria)]